MDVSAKRQNATLTQLVASEIRAQMGREDITRRELARRLDTTHTWVATRVRGEVPIDFNDLERIAEALDVPWTKLLPERLNADSHGYPQAPDRDVRDTRLRRTLPTAGLFGPNSRLDRSPAGQLSTSHPDMIVGIAV